MRLCLVSGPDLDDDSVKRETESYGGGQQLISEAPR